MSDKQRTLKFYRDENFRNLEKAMTHFAEWCPPELQSRHGLPRSLTVLLKQIEFCSGSDGFSNARVEVLAARCDLQRRSLFRVLNDAVMLGLLTKVKSLSLRTGGQGPNRYYIQWTRIAAIADRYPDIAPSGVRSPGCKDVTPGCKDVTPGCKDVTPINKELNPPLIPHLKSPPPGRASPPEWQEVGVLLRSLDVRCWRSAVRHARANGCDAAYVLRLLAYCRSKPGAWGSGAIYERVCNAFPNDPPEALWPKPSQKSLDAERAKREAAASRPIERARDATADRLRELEADVGPRLDAMSDGERRRLAAGLGAFERSLFARHGWQAVRSRLLELLSLDEELRAREGGAPARRGS